MIDPRVLAAADASVGGGANFDRGGMTQAQRQVWLDAAFEVHRRLIGEPSRSRRMALGAELYGFVEAPADHPIYSEGPTITFLTADQAARLRAQLNKGKD